MASYEGAQGMNKHIPPGARVGSFDSGVLGYFAVSPVTNLDGLINSLEYHRACQAGKSRDYFLATGIEFLCNAVLEPAPGTTDDFNAKFWQRFGGGPPPGRMECIYSAPTTFLVAGERFRFKAYRFVRSGG